MEEKVSGINCDLNLRNTENSSTAEEKDPTAPWVKRNSILNEDKIELFAD